MQDTTRSPLAYTSDSGVPFGAAVGSRRTVALVALFDYLAAGATIGDFLKAYPGITRPQVLAVLDDAKQALLLGDVLCQGQPRVRRERMRRIAPRRTGPGLLRQPNL